MSDGKPGSGSANDATLRTWLRMLASVNGWSNPSGLRSLNTVPFDVPLVRWLVTIRGVGMRRSAIMTAVPSRRNAWYPIAKRSGWFLRSLRRPEEMPAA
jgi:hypothetical protein